MTAYGAAAAERLARHERDVAAYRARTLAAVTGCAVTPHARPGRFEVTVPGGALIGTAGEILAWHQEARTPECREAALREWLAVRGRQGGRP
jgi:hypothetical protein